MPSVEPPLRAYLMGLFESPHALSAVALCLGVFGLVGGIWALRSPDSAQRFCRGFPRNENIGRILILIDLVWSLLLLEMMNLGGWNQYKKIVYGLSPIIYIYIIRYVNHYLGARSLALFLILAAKPVVIICFLRDEPSRLILTTLAYIWVAMGMCFVAAPHWMRDLIAYFTASPVRWEWGSRLKVAASGCLLALGLFVY
jgi:hypothetical protein